MSQNKIMEGSYILAFYNNVGTLNNYYAQYQNLILEVKQQYSNNIELFKKINELPENQRETIRTATQALRIIAVQVYMQYESLKKQIKVTKEQDEAIQTLYTDVTDKYIPESDKIKDYVLKFNQVLTNDILHNLFDTSQDILDIKNNTQNG